MWTQPFQLHAPVSGLPPVIEVARGSVSNEGVLDFTDLPLDIFRFELRFKKLEPVTNNDNFNLRVSSNGGTTYDSGANDYQWTSSGSDIGTTVFRVAGSGSASALQLNDNQGHGNGSNFFGAGVVNIYGLQDASVRTQVNGQMTYQGSSAYAQVTFGGQRFGLTAHNAFRLFFGAGNINTMDYVLLAWR